MAAEFVSYILSFLYIGIYWNHHHLLHTVRRPPAAILRANLLLLFWPSMVPFATAWMGGFPTDAAPTAAYGVVMLFAAIAYTVLEGFILHGHADDSPLARAIGSGPKGSSPCSATWARSRWRTCVRHSVKCRCSGSLASGSCRTVASSRPSARNRPISRDSFPRRR